MSQFFFFEYHLKFNRAHFSLVLCISCGEAIRWSLPKELHNV
uniref:Uncharacterized protein n=1 Tax=Arundo donax TaxID=35708 RepID=A0A0A8ZJ41_ARUDO